MNKKQLHQQKQKEKEESSSDCYYYDNNNLPTKSRLIFEVDQGHRSKYTANKYRVDFNHFLDFIKIHDREVLLDLGKEAIQELVIRYAISLRDNPEKKYSRSTVNNRIAAVFYFMDNNDIELNKRKIRQMNL